MKLIDSKVIEKLETIIANPDNTKDWSDARLNAVETIIETKNYTRAAQQLNKSVAGVWKQCAKALATKPSKPKKEAAVEEFVIESGIPIPKMQMRGYSEAFRKLKVGDSILLKGHRGVYTIASRIGIKVTAKLVAPGQVRVWRIS